MNYAIVDDITNLVTSTVIWDGLTGWTPPTGSSAVEIPEGSLVSTYWEYVGGIFSPPTYWYSTVSTEEYALGQLVGSNPPNPQPLNSTSLVPPTSATGQTLQWTGTEWVYAPFDWNTDLATAKTTMVSKTNATAYGILQPTDWLVTRLTENGTQIPSDWNAWRQEIRTQASDKTYKINTCASKEELNAYCQSDAYLVWANQPTTPTN